MPESGGVPTEWRVDGGEDERQPERPDFSLPLSRGLCFSAVRTFLGTNSRVKSVWTLSEANSTVSFYI